MTSIKRKEKVYPVAFTVDMAGEVHKLVEEKTSDAILRNARYFRHGQGRKWDSGKSNSDISTKLMTTNLSLSAGGTIGEYYGEFDAMNYSSTDFSDITKYGIDKKNKQKSGRAKSSSSSNSNTQSLYSKDAFRKPNRSPVSQDSMPLSIDDDNAPNEWIRMLLLDFDENTCEKYWLPHFPITSSIDSGGEHHEEFRESNRITVVSQELTNSLSNDDSDASDEWVKIGLSFPMNTSNNSVGQRQESRKPKRIRFSKELTKISSNNDDEASNDCFDITSGSPIIPTSRQITDEPKTDDRVTKIEDTVSNTETCVDSEWSAAPSQYISSSYAYAGFGTGPPPGEKKYKSDKELNELMPPECYFLGGGRWYRQLYFLIRLIIAMSSGLCVLGGMTYSYKIGLDLLETHDERLGFGLYGAGLVTFMSVQSFFAYLENRSYETSPPPDDYATTVQKKIVLQISAYQEDPHYFRECLKGIMRLKYPEDKFRVVCSIDGNGDDSVYMAEIFMEVIEEFGKEPVFFRWDYNYHELPDDVGESDSGLGTLRECIETNRFVCIMQKWGGKREVMYTVFRTIQDIADYVQVCDSDTQLDPDAMLELVWVLDSKPEVGAVGGDVRIWNSGDSFVSFLSSLRYWAAFNVERTCQSYFGCVSCISGPIGLYRMSLLNQLVELWSDQKFLGEVCTFGDDRHLTNRILQMGYSTKFTSRSFCKTETPSAYLRWLSQQIRWSKSYYREWLFNAMWWHKHHPWMTIESVFSGFFPFFIIVTVVSITWSGKLWALIHLLLIIQFIGLLKGFFACLVKQDVLMIFFSLYSCLYITSLLPAKPFAIMTIKKKGWGTSGRNNLLKSYNALIPVSAWMLVVGGGLVYSTILNDYSKEGELYYLTAGIGVYALYWIIMIILWKVIVQKNQKTIEEIKNESIANSNPVASEAVEAESTDLTGNNLDELERGEATKAPEDDFP